MMLSCLKHLGASSNGKQLEIPSFSLRWICCFRMTISMHKIPRALNCMFTWWGIHFYGPFSN
uniref:Uncharacterized protein n=1 Tax=Salix viminalis TaxID=40686 RepID=A0A6N2L419_SALVM